MKFEWEKIDLVTVRAKVFGGWVLSKRFIYGNGSESLCFISDINHEWKIDEEQTSNE